jgi:multiple sugar transport system ATP-binding protein
MGGVTLRGVRKLYGALEVIKGIDLAIQDKEFVVFVGPSGCGKSTLLRMIAGLEDVDFGTIDIAGRDVTELAPARRGVAMVFQNYALYPHMTVYDNMAYGLRRAGLAKQDVDRRVRDTARLLQIDGLLGRKPREMSGGQRQRVAIGRAIVREPKVFLFDEPLSNLDASLRIETRSQIAKLHRELQATMIFVTHDQVEAMTLAQRIVVLNGGRIEQVGTPQEVYHHPANLFVAGFIGSPAMNLIPASLRTHDAPRAVLRLADGADVTWRGFVPNLAVGSELTLGLRPERLGIASSGRGDLSAEVTLVEDLGDQTILHVVSGTAALRVKHAGSAVARPGDRIPIDIDMDGATLFGSDGCNLGQGHA